MSDEPPTGCYPFKGLIKNKSLLTSSAMVACGPQLFLTSGCWSSRDSNPNSFARLGGSTESWSGVSRFNPWTFCMKSDEKQSVPAGSKLFHYTRMPDAYLMILDFALLLVLFIMIVYLLFQFRYFSLLYVLIFFQLLHMLVRFRQMNHQFVFLFSQYLPKKREELQWALKCC